MDGPLVCHHQSYGKIICGASRIQILSNPYIRLGSNICTDFISWNWCILSTSFKPKVDELLSITLYIFSTQVVLKSKKEWAVRHNIEWIPWTINYAGFCWIIISSEGLKFLWIWNKIGNSTSACALIKVAQLKKRDGE